MGLLALDHLRQDICSHIGAPATSLLYRDFLLEGFLRGFSRNLVFFIPSLWREQVTDKQINKRQSK